MKKVGTFLMIWCLSAVALMAQTQTNVQATVAGSTGLVEFAPPGSTVFQRVSQEIPIPAGSTLRTGATGQATLIPFPGMAYTISPNTELQTPAMNIATQNNHISKKTGVVDLVKGMVTIVIDKNAAKRVPVDFRVKTASSVAAAVGTKYIVVQVDGVSYVKVVEGTVNFGAPGGALSPITSTSGVARLNADGTVQFVPDTALPANVLLAMKSAPLKETSAIAGVPDETTLLVGGGAGLPDGKSPNPIMVQPETSKSSPTP